jgi:hypothetical protein
MVCKKYYSRLYVLLLCCSLPCISIACSGCAYAPLFKKDQDIFKREVGDLAQETKRRIAHNAKTIHDVVVEPKERAIVIAEVNAKETKRWAEEQVEFSAPSGFGDLLDIGMGLAGLFGMGGGVQLFRKLKQAQGVVAEVASANPEDGKRIAKEKGYKV